MSEPTTVDSSPVIPLHGTDAARMAAALANKIRTNEVHITDEGRMFIENKLVAGRFHYAASQAAMLALNATSQFGCWRDDWCLRADKVNGSGDYTSIFLCIAGRGTLIEQWIEIPTKAGVIAAAEPSFYYAPVTNGDLTNPSIIYVNGAVVMVRVEI